MPESRQQQAERWRRTARATLETAKHLREREDYRSCVSRAYYATYQAATFVCLIHGDDVHFPADWNNPTHEQLPDLIANNGGFALNARRTARKILRELRALREDSDYRMGRTVDAKTVKAALLMATSLFERLEIEDGSD
jgi:uncharacterized protein (UPF0332 family)